MLFMRFYDQSNEKLIQIVESVITNSNKSSKKNRRNFSISSVRINQTLIYLITN